MHHLKKTMSFLALCVFAVLTSSCGGGGGAGGSQPADPVLEDIPIAYISRALPTVTDNGQTSVAEEDLTRPADFHAGAKLILRERATPTAAEKIITDRVWGADAQYDVKDLEVSYDGKKLLFAMRGPEIEDDEAEEDELPSWDIWEYNRVTDELRRVIESDVTEVQGEDINPHYLPDGRIVFASTRQIVTKSIQLDESKPQYNPQGESRQADMFALHIMDSDGSDITQITFNSNNEIEPVVNRNGEIVYLRWDDVATHDEINLFKLRPDGTEHHILYGKNSHATGSDGAEIEYRRLQLAPDGRLLAMIGPRTDTVYGGQMIYLDTENFSDNDQAVPTGTSSAATAQTDATHLPVRSDDEISLGGYLSAAYPLWDGTPRMLLSWSECRVQNGNTVLPCTAERVAAAGATVLPPAYGLWMYQTDDQTMRPLILAEANRIYSDAVVMQERTLPPVLDAKTDDDITFDESIVEDNVGILHIRSVYDLDGSFTGLGSSATTLDQMKLLPPSQRPARFLRLEKAVLMPDNDVVDIPGTAFGRAGAQLMREILAYAPIEPDGSVKVKVTANVPFTLSILDENGQSISTRHQYWLQLAPGEIVTCNGCHAATSTTPHGRIDARPASINSGAATDGALPGLNPQYTAIAGETLAETRVRLEDSASLGGAGSLPSADIVFKDIWSVTAEPNSELSARYADLDDDTDPDNDDIELPTNASCAPVWTALCRVTLHYPDHIAPLWNRSRPELDADGNPVVDPITLTPIDNQCNTCHSTESATLAVPVFGSTTQLDLRNEESEAQPDHLISYRDLFFTSNAQEIEIDPVTNAASLIDKPRRDANGDVICQNNEQGEPIVDPVTGECTAPVIETVPPIMSSAGARSSRNFFAPFNTGGSHEGWLSPVELKMISEWLDIGAQYYNSPFGIPQG